MHDPGHPAGPVTTPGAVPGVSPAPPTSPPSPAPRASVRPAADAGAAGPAAPTAAPAAPPAPVAPAAPGPPAPPAPPSPAPPPPPAPWPPAAPAAGAAGRPEEREAPGAAPSYDVVVPTVGRPSLASLLDSLVRSLPAGARVIVVDDRRAPGTPLVPPGTPAMDDPRVVVATSGGRGPAAARNVGWRRSSAAWVAFLDDDVDLPPDWVRALEDDLRRAGPEVGAVKGRLHVPLPAGRRPTDWERNVHALEVGRWVTADMAVHRAVLARVGGFDERFPRAYREDVDLALRALDDGWRLEEGRRQVRHPVRPAPWWVSVSQQRGNGDDVLMERLHGRHWRRRLGVVPGTYRAHRATTLTAALALVATVTGRRRLALAAAAWWALRTGRFAWSRIAPGPRTPREVAAMALTSVAVPPAATLHRLRAHLRWARPGPAPR